MRLRFLVLLAVFAWAGWVPPLHACSLVEGYVRPSSFEMVQLADAIAVATPEAARGEFAVAFRIERAVKGRPPARVTVNLATLGPDSIGMCSRSGFVMGGRYLLFLVRNAEGRWQRLDYPYARSSEDYDGEGGAWSRTVRRYVVVQAMRDPMAQIAALRAMLASGRDPRGAVLSADDREDISDHLVSLSQWKPTAFLLAAYAAAERGEPVPRRESEEDLYAEFGPDLPAPRDAVRLSILNALSNGAHPGARAFIERLQAAPGTTARMRGPILRYFARNGRFALAYRWIETRLSTQLELAEPAEARALLADVDEIMHGEDYNPMRDGTARWQRDAPAAATWPELALALFAYQLRTFGGEPRSSFADAIAAIPVSDYRARPLLTIALVTTYNEDAERWAEAELARLPAGDAGTPEPGTDPNEGYGGRMDAAADPAFLPLRAFATNWSAERDDILVRAFCRAGPRRRALLFHVIGRWGDRMYGDLLAAMGAFPGLGESERGALMRAAAEMEGRYWGASGLRFAPEDGEDRALRRLLRGVPEPTRAVRCDGAAAGGG